MKKELRIGIFVLIVLAIFAYFVIKTGTMGNLFSRAKSYPIYAKFSTVSGLYTSSHVRLAGVRIGIVQDISLEGNKALVKMLIKDKFPINEDARAVIASVGIVGENFVEIVYKDEFKTDSPKKLEAGDYIRTLSYPGLEVITEKFDTISDKIGTLLDSVNGILAKKESRESITTALENIKDITGNLKQLSGEKGKLNAVFDDFDQLSSRLKHSLENLDKFVGNLDRSFYKDKDSLIPQLQEVARHIKAIAGDLETITGNVKEGKGTAGKLLKDDSLYKKLDDSIDSVKNIITDLEKKKENIDKTRLNYYAGIDYFTTDKEARFSFGLNLDFSKFTLFTRVREDTLDGSPFFTLMAGKRFGPFSAAAGMVDSGLGAALYLHLFKDRINVEVEASRFYRTDTPLFKTNVSIYLTRYINLSLGYEDIMEKEGRKFSVGLSFSN
jgi:phospholipid/cholesterol/gamma-HCH transport system substrate-binding protein